MQKSTTDMTEGNIWLKIVIFSLPLLLGQICQQLYNTFDTWCVGNFVGKNAFSAVGTVGAIINMLIGFSTGFSSGASVVISQYYGAKDYEKVKTSSHTFFTFMLILSLVITVLGTLLTPLMIKVVASPPEVAKEQRIYLSIYFAGISGLIMYNMGSAMFRAVGNSRLPFIFLVISAALNIVMDLVFVINLGLGTAGVAYATIIAQAMSAVCVLVFLKRTSAPIRLYFRELKIDWKILSRIIKIGLPAALQMAITAFSNVFVQSYINYFGADVMGGWTAYTKVDQYILLPMQCLGIASMTFVGQNYGSKNIARAQKGANTAFFTAFCITGSFLIPIVAFAPNIVEFFIGKNETEVIRYGTMFLRYISPFYIICCLNQVYAHALRGIGKSQIPMFVMLGSFVFARQIYLFVVSHYISNTILPIAYAYPFGWVLCSSLITISYFIAFNKEKRKLLTPKAQLV